MGVFLIDDCFAGEAAGGRFIACNDKGGKDNARQ